MSGDGPQMSAALTREFMTLCWLATRRGRPWEPAPTRSWIEALFGQLKREFPNRNVIIEIDVHPNLKVLGSGFCSVT